MDTTGVPERKRGGCLTAWLILMMVFNPLVTIYYLVSGSAIQNSMPAYPSWGIPVMIVLTLVNLACAIALWGWRKWGLYGLIASSLVAFLINVFTLGFAASVSGLVGIVIMIALVRPVWKQME